MAHYNYHHSADSQTQPIIGGSTAVTLTSADTLQSLGISATPLGSATIDASGAKPVAQFPITYGTVGPDSSTVILHQASGLELADATGEVDLQNFRIDTQNALVDADVSINGESVGNVAVFDIGADGQTLTLTSEAADAVDQALGTMAITPDVVIGTAAPWPVTDSFRCGQSEIQFLYGTDTDPVTGGATDVTLTSAGTLQSLGVTVTPLGSASIDTSSTDPIAQFPITGGTEGPDSFLVLLHQGSGLELSDSAGTIDLRDFLIDTKNSAVTANVSVNGEPAGNVPVFSLGGTDGTTLTLTSAAAGVVGKVLGTTAITSDVVIGTAAPSPVTLHA
jgi:hypothetical protein